MTKRANGEGSISRRGKRWLAQITVGKNAAGKIVRRTVTGKTQQEVREKLDALRRDRTDGRLVAAGAASMTVGELLDKWLTDICEPKDDPNTHRRNAGIVRNHLKPDLGQIKLSKLTTMHIDELFARLQKKGLGARSRQLTRWLLNAALRQAVIWRLIGSNPCNDATRVKVTRRECNTLSADQLQAVFDAARPHRNFAYWYLAAVTGMRRGELVALKWSDIQLGGDQPYLTVKRSGAYGGGGGWPRIKEAKTRRSHRKIDLPAEAVAVLKEHRAQSMREGFAGVPWVFVSTVGKLLCATHLAQNWKAIIRKAGVPYVRPHDLRHSHATLLLLGGINPKVVQERLGHSQISVTMDTYSHVLPSMQREAADKIGELIKAPA